MTLLSKFARIFASAPYNCYDIAHPLTESCSDFALTAFMSSLKQSIVLYSGLHALNRIVSGRITPDAIFASLSHAMRSSLFLSFNVYFFNLFTCQQSRLFGNIRTTTPAVSGLLSSLLAIFIEQKRRRKLLALYMLNIATETLYRLIWEHCHLRPVPYFDVILYMTSLAAYAYRATTSSAAKDDAISKMLMFFAGSRQKLQIAPVSQCESISLDGPPPEQEVSGQDWWNRIKSMCRTPPSHTVCAERLCLQHALHSGGRALLIGLLGSMLLNIPKAIRGQPVHLFSRKALGLPLFLCGMSAGTNIAQCLLQRVLPSNIAHSVAVLLSASSIVFYRSNTIALYVFWRAVELYCASEGKQQRIPHFTELLYAISCAVVFHAAVVEPESVRYSYVHFLDRLTGYKLSQMNREPLMMYGFKPNDVFDTDDLLRELNVARVSPKFLEMVLIWSLQ